MTPAPVPDSATWPDESTGPLWPNRCRTLGRLVINRSNPPPVPKRQVQLPSWLRRLGDPWKRKSPPVRWAVAVLLLPLFVLYAVPFQVISGEAYVAAVSILICLLGLSLWLAGDRPTPRPLPDPEGKLLARLAGSERPEANVAAAASRAWNEIVAEPAWASPWMAGQRAGFDGAAEVAQIVETALEIMVGRQAVGRQADGVAKSAWHRQHAVLDDAAHRLGTRADCLIRLRDRVTALSRALHHLEELQRMERSALVVDDIVVQTAYGYADHEQRMSAVADEIAGLRLGVEDLLAVLHRKESR